MLTDAQPIMKKILVLTDFSDNAAKASEIAVEFGKKLNANILLFNSYSKLPTIASYAGGSWAVDEVMHKQGHSKNHLSLVAENLQNIPVKNGIEPEMPTITYLSEEGDLGSNVAEISKLNNIELIMMGARDKTSHENILFGSDTKSVLRKAKRPVLFIPAKFDLEKLNKVVFATDFEADDMVAIKYLLKLGGLFNFKLEIVHVSGLKKEAPDEDELTFMNQFKKIRYENISYQNIKGADIVNRLNRFIAETDAGMLAMVHHQESFLMDILRESITRKALLNQKIPMMIFPSKMMDEL